MDNFFFFDIIFLLNFLNFFERQPFIIGQGMQILQKGYFLLLQFLDLWRSCLNAISGPHGVRWPAHDLCHVFALKL